MILTHIIGTLSARITTGKQRQQRQKRSIKDGDPQKPCYWAAHTSLAQIFVYPPPPPPRERGSST